MLSITNFDKQFSFKDLVCVEFSLDGRPLSPWETLYQQTHSVDCGFLRRILEGTLRARHYSEKQKKWHMFRYYHGLFDSVSDYFVIVDVLLPTLCVLPAPKIHVVDGWAIQEPFRTSMCQQHEVSPNSSRFSSMHDFDYGRLQDEKWGKDTVMREKLNGSPLYRVNYDGKKYMMGFGMAILVSDDFPISVMEWTHEGCFVLFPFAFPVYIFEGVTFYPHDWVSVDALTASTYDHGAVFLIGGIEYRARKYPSVEVDAGDYPESRNKGVWEKTEHAFLRPRPGRAPMSRAKATSALGFAVPLACIQLPLSTNKVINKKSGPYLGSWGTGDSGPWFDSGVRIVDEAPVIAPYPSDVRSESATLIGDVYNIETPSGIVITPFLTPHHKRVVTGAKVVIFNDYLDICLIQEDGKKLDLVGGKIEVGESSYDALQREIREETGLNLEPKFVGISSQFDHDCEFHSYVYVAPCNFDVRKYPQLKFISGYDYDAQESVPWLGRLLTYVAYRAGGKSQGLPKLYASLDKPKYQLRRHIYGRDFERGEATYTTRKTGKKRDEAIPEVDERGFIPTDPYGRDLSSFTRGDAPVNLTFVRKKQ